MQYEDDGFWWDSQSRIVPLQPVYPYYIEPNVFALAKYDTLDLTRDGIIIDKVNTAQIFAFGRSFRALPKQKFELAGKRTDPVAVRKLKGDGKLYFYAVNTEPYPITITVSLNKKQKFQYFGQAKRLPKPIHLLSILLHLKAFLLMK